MQEVKAHIRRELMKIFSHVHNIFLCIFLFHHSNFFFCFSFLRLLFSTLSWSCVIGTHSVENKRSIIAWLLFSNREPDGENRYNVKRLFVILDEDKSLMRGNRWKINSYYTGWTNKEKWLFHFRSMDLSYLNIILCA